MKASVKCAHGAMKTSVLKNRLLEKFIMQEFVSGNLETKESVDSMVDFVSRKLNLSLAESADFIRKAIGIQ